MRTVIGILVVLLLALQYKVWFGDAGYLEASALDDQVTSQRDRAELLAERNRLLTAEVLALRDGYAAVEARARSDLGMIKQGETFFLVPARLRASSARLRAAPARPRASHAHPRRDE